MSYPIRKTLVAATLVIASLMLAASTNRNTVADSPNTSVVSETNVPTPSPAPAPTPNPDSNIHEGAMAAAAIYSGAGLKKAGLNQRAFELAWEAYESLEEEGRIEKSDLLTVIDFSQPSTKKRLYVIDVDDQKILYQSVVSHGRNTGALWAKKFSNRVGSNMSSPGLYLTAETYMGGNGYSLRLDGLDRGINDNARRRAIVMHGAPYASESTIRSLGYLGRSQGCPALPVSISKKVINTIKGGSVLYIYAPQ